METMIFSIVLSLSLVVLVSSNNGFQPYEPSIYRNNIYTTLPTSPPVDNTPYLQINTAQNPVTTQEKIPPFNIRQILLNRILSSPPLQTILEQNSKGYGINPLDCNTNTKETFLRNNYEASPMDYDRLNNDVRTKNKNNESNIESDEHRRKNKRRKGSKSRRKSEEGKNNHNHNNTEDNTKEISKKSKKRSRKPKQDPSKENQVNNDENLNTKDVNRHSKRKNKENETNTEAITTENPKPRRKHKKKSKSDANSTATANLEQQIPQLRVINPDLNLANFCEGVTEECRQPRNSKLENLDIQKPVTNLVENFPNNFSFKPFQQLYSNPSMTNFLTNYENIYKNMLHTNSPTNEPRTVNKNKPKNTRKTQKKSSTNNKNSTVTTIDIITPSTTVKPNINETTEKLTQVQDVPQANNNFTTETESFNSIDKPVDENAKLLVKVPVDIETEDTEKEAPFLNYYDGYIDDYYPLFTDNAAYTANNREVYVKHLGDIKYYYTVDKNNPETFNLPAPVTKEYHKNKNYEEIENTHPRNEIGEEVVQFRTPPLLEVPDFQTRKVERVEINPEAYYNRNEIPKTSTYSPAKQSNMEVKKNALKTTEDRNIETVFAKSKVAKYGTAYKPEENDISSEEANETKEELIKEDSFKDSGTTYVIAKSVAPFW